jgi:hypothetical protein
LPLQAKPKPVHAPSARYGDRRGDLVRVVTERDFLDRPGEMLGTDDVILVMREGQPVGFFLPWQTPEIPKGVRREVFLHLTEEIAAQREARGVTERELLGDFAAERTRR